MEMDVLQARIRQFADDRDWGTFHTPKNLVMAIAAEAGELIEHFQWLTPEESFALPKDQQGEVGAELADILIYLLRLSDVAGIDLSHAVEAKLSANAEKYPVGLSRGNATKYSRRHR
jgi:dCTP diphosphatase